MHEKIRFVLLILEQEDRCTRTTHTHNTHTTIQVVVIAYKHEVPALYVANLNPGDVVPGTMYHPFVSWSTLFLFSCKNLLHYEIIYIN